MNKLDSFHVGSFNHFEPVLLLDVETSAHKPGEIPDLCSVTLLGVGYKRVFVIDSSTSRHVQAHPNIVWCPDVQTCLRYVIDAIEQFDPTSLTSRGELDFELEVLQQHCERHGISFPQGLGVNSE